jgi:hypothetical protein
MASGLFRVRTVAAAAAVSAVGLATVLMSTSHAGSGVSCDGRQATKVGTPGNDNGGRGQRPIIEGTNRSDVINGRGGNDIILGKGGRDHLCGGRGTDQIFGGAFVAGVNVEEEGGGADRLFGGSGIDLLEGGGQNDELFGFTGNDDLAGGRGDDLLVGGDDNDDLSGGPDNDNCDQGPGSGTTFGCETDLAVDVNGPGTAAPGVIRYTVLVRNLGPSDVDGYKLRVESRNSHLQCDENFAVGIRPQGPLSAGGSRSHIFSVTCQLEGPPPNQVNLSAKVFLEADSNETNDFASADTTVS